MLTISFRREGTVLRVKDPCLCGTVCQSVGRAGARAVHRRERLRRDGFVIWWGKGHGVHHTWRLQNFSFLLAFDFILPLLLSVSTSPSVLREPANLLRVNRPADGGLAWNYYRSE
jgi:hypothetical protein